MKENIISLLCGLVFSLGLGVSQMTRPPKIIGFLNIFGDWDPTLGFVFLGALSVYMIGYWFVVDESIKKPLEDYLSTKEQLNKEVVIGSILFGVGWGLLGICPGPALVNLGAFKPSIYVFILGMILGMYIGRYIERRKQAIF